MSYEYLKQENVIPVSLANEVGRIGKHVVELSPEDEERAMRLHKESTVIELHNHFHVLPENLQDFETYARSGRIATGYEGIKQSGMTASLMGIGGSVARRSSPAPWQFDDIVWDLGMRQADMDHHPDVVTRGRSVKDILEAKKSGRTAVFLMIENAGVIGNDLDRLDVLYGLGIRCMGVSYNQKNFIADGLSEKADSGLSDFGFKVVERMNRLGMLIDLCHSSDLSQKQVLEVSEARCCLSHTPCARLERQSQRPVGRDAGVYCRP